MGDFTVCLECYAPKGRAHRSDCSRRGDDDDELAARIDRGGWAQEFLDHPEARGIVEGFGKEAERRCLELVTKDPQAAQLAAVEAMLARRLLKRIEDYARDGRVASQTMDSLAQQARGRDTRVTRARGRGRTSGGSQEH